MKISWVSSLLCLLTLSVACNRGEGTAEPETRLDEGDVAVLEESAVKARQPAGIQTIFDETQIREVQVYYRHAEYEGLIPLRRTIITNSPEAQLLQVVDHLTIEPEESEGVAVWPRATYVREVYLLGNGVAVIDLHPGFLAKLNAGVATEVDLVASLVNSVLENFSDFSEVQILVNGEVRETLLGHVDIEAPLPFNRRIYTVIPEPRLEDEITIEELNDSPTLDAHEPGP